MMKRLAGVLAGTALLGGLALANQDTVGSGPTTPTESTATADTGPGTGGSEQSQVPGVASGQIATAETHGNQLIGTVVESKSHTLYLQHMGVVVPLRVDKQTKLEGLAGKKLTDLRSGDEVKVDFLVRNRIENVATRISLPSATGGSGLGTTQESRDLGTGGSSAGSSQTGEDANVGGRPTSPEEKPMKEPMDPSRDREDPIY